MAHRCWTVIFLYMVAAVSSARLGPFEMRSSVELEGPQLVDDKWCLSKMPRKWGEHFRACKRHLFNIFGALYVSEADGVDMSDIFLTARRNPPKTTSKSRSPSTESTAVSNTNKADEAKDDGASKSRSPSIESTAINNTNKADEAKDDGFVMCTRAESRGSVQPRLADMANHVLFLYPLYTEKNDFVFSLIMSHPTAMWRLVKWALAGYKTTFVRVATRADAIAELRRIEAGKLRHLVVGGHGDALHRFINLGKEYLTTSDQLFADNVGDYKVKNKVAYEETVELFTEATKRMGDVRTAPQTSLLLDSCQTAHQVQLDDTGEITSFFDDVVNIVQKEARKGQKIKIVGATECFNSAQISTCLKPASKGDVWCASIAKEWSFLFWSGQTDVTKRITVEP